MYEILLIICKRVECRALYSPENVQKDFPEANLMVCEQTFSWLGKASQISWPEALPHILKCSNIIFKVNIYFLGRYKKILNSMPRLHFLFILHRLVIHRNRQVNIITLSTLETLCPGILNVVKCLASTHYCPQPKLRKRKVLSSHL